MSVINSPQPVSVELESGGRIVETSEPEFAGPEPWVPIKVSGAEIAATIERLSAAQGSACRIAYLVHPESAARSFAPGIEVTVEVLLPGERTSPRRRNSSLVEICIEGQGDVVVDDTTFTLVEHDVCTVPSMKPHRFVNDGTERWVRLAYSNAPLLAFLGTHYEEAIAEDWVPTASVDGPIDMDEPVEVDRSSAPDFEILSAGARLRGYEFLVGIEPAPNRPLQWPYEVMRGLMSQRVGDKKRTIMALYNPATERKQGATGSFFVTLSQIPPGHRPRREGRGHRHSSVAINYHFEGTGYSIVDDVRIDWGPGDLLLSAPSWREHAHYPSETGMSVYTVQDHPLHIGMESLIWQEVMTGPILALGQESGLTGYVAPRNWDDE